MSISSPQYLAATAAIGLTAGASAASSPAMPAGITSFMLDNGLEVVVIEDHRAPVVTHMVWYRNGSADDPPMKSGIAHFLEHLMFKGTHKHAKGAFSTHVAELGGQENAFISSDYTAYYQRVAKEHLGIVMDYEADRMVNLVLDDATVNPERDVVLEERRMRTDSDPGAQLQEAVQAALFTQHPYGKPVIGWEHEIETLNRSDALAYYQRFYTPENAILIIAGDVTPDEVRVLAQGTYGAIPARGEKPRHIRPQEPPPRAHRLVTLADEKVEQPSQQRIYLVPSVMTAAPGVCEALDVLCHMLGGGQTSLLYKSLVIDQQIAVAAGAYYMGTAVDRTRFFVYAVPAEGISLETLDAAVEAVIAAIARDGVDDADLVRAKTRLMADMIYAQDSQSSMARWFGSALATGMSIAEITSWPQRLEAVSAADVRAAAASLDKNCAVTGFLLPKASAAS